MAVVVGELKYWTFLTLLLLLLVHREVEEAQNDDWWMQIIQARSKSSGAA
jgi:hypothetical protein